MYNNREIVASRVIIQPQQRPPCLELLNATSLRRLHSRCQRVDSHTRYGVPRQRCQFSFSPPPSFIPAVISETNWFVSFILCLVHSCCAENNRLDIHHCFKGMVSYYSAIALKSTWDYFNTQSLSSKTAFKLRWNCPHIWIIMQQLDHVSLSSTEMSYILDEMSIIIS